MILKLCKCQGPVIERGGETEAEIDQHLFARAVSCEHAANLGQRDMRFIHHQQVIIGQVVHQRPRLLACPASRQVARIVFDPGAEASLAQHLDIEVGALLQTRRLQEFSLCLKHGQALF